MAPLIPDEKLAGSNFSLKIADTSNDLAASIVKITSSVFVSFRAPPNS